MFQIIQADALRLPLADRSVDLVLGSPPYMDARTYGIGAQRKMQDWINWMVLVTAEALRVARNCVVWVVGGVTRDRTYWPGCEGLAYEWVKRGGSMYRPVCWHRVGIPGSGGNDWFRADIEQCLCFKRPGRLPYSDNTAMGHPPKCAPGGEMSNRLKDGSRRDIWGGAGGIGRGRRADGKPKKKFMRQPAGHRELQIYTPPVLANPGNLIRTQVGGGLMGSKLAHENEAPYPEALAEWWLRSLSAPGHTVLDPFSGSGTTAKVALSLGRNAIASDIRANQCDLTRRRILEVQQEIFT